MFRKNYQPHQIHKFIEDNCRKSEADMVIFANHCPPYLLESMINLLNEKILDDCAYLYHIETGLMKIIPVVTSKAAVKTILTQIFADKSILNSYPLDEEEASNLHRDAVYYCDNMRECELYKQLLEVLEKVYSHQKTQGPENQKPENP